MSLASGSRLGQHEILAAIGACGMGEVYRAKDTNLGRDVTLKMLPASFTTDPERVARFRREAQVLASLNHPHIAQIHGMEEANGTQFLVLELVDGESLDKRIGRGPIPVDEALGIAKQMAETLEAAHEKWRLGAWALEYWREVPESRSRTRTASSTTRSGPAHPRDGVPMTLPIEWLLPCGSAQSAKDRQPGCISPESSRGSEAA